MPAEQANEPDSLSIDNPMPPPPEPKQTKRLIRHRHKVLLSQDVAPFAWPIAIELTCVVLMSIASTILVSRIGKADTAAVGVSDSLTFIVISFLTAIALGGSVFIAQLYAKHDRENCIRGAAHAINLNLVFSLVAWIIVQCFAGPILSVVAYGAEAEVIRLTQMYLQTIAFSFPALAILFAGSGVLRAVGNSRLPAISNILMNVLNILISYPLIYGLSEWGIGTWQGFGLLGAGIGITLARWIGALMILVCLMKNRTFSVPLRAFFQPFRKNILNDILGVGIPASIESMMFNFGKLLTQVMVAGMGTVAMAGNYITFSIILLLNIPGNTLSMASTVIIGKRLGQDRPKTAAQEMRLIFWVATILLILLGVVSVPLAEWIARGYTSDPEVIDVVVNLLYLNAIMLPVWAASFVLPSAFKGARDVKYTMYSAIISMWGCRVVLGYILGIVLDLGVYGVWLGMFADWWLRGSLYFLRMLNQRWLTKYQQRKAETIVVTSVRRTK
ncbi:EmmdR/YeeO family multidrug/toxin efflux MATE transporter [Vibrio salinus]|uniref:EmmdR/YeeO family multidrug/toxin efflux MATE transporter n=1 Tax=Vibrio salinus TaxID=2899784 RepID=UPI001E626004|nr:EmmdR/YeeO family multidrug/toxin efflux MATE transporter [Vibrio salinus]MCE0496056.1 EmmdR/YeeO family multidrug/toxin efflux MATE transporter [Vibrio salinus]